MSSVLSMAPWGFLFTHKGKGPATGSQTPGILLLPRDFLSHQLTSEPFKLDFLHPRCPLLLFPAPPPLHPPLLLTLITFLPSLTQAAFFNPPLLSLIYPHIPSSVSVAASPGPNLSNLAIEQEEIGGLSQVIVSERIKIHH